MKYVVIVSLLFVGCASVGTQRQIASVTAGVVVPAQGFICQDYTLYSAAGQITSNFNSKAECQAAVALSKNGFICRDYTLYSAAGQITSNFNSKADCQAAVNASK